MRYPARDQYGVDDLLEIVAILRAPGGCPWDREQTHDSIRSALIEETYETADAIDRADAGLLCEELGDLLLQVVMHAQIERETGGFTFSDVCDGVCRKLIYRHPHVFGGVRADTAGQVLQNWEKLKNVEKGRLTVSDRLDSVPASLPALMRGAKVQKRAADFGFGHAGLESALADLRGQAAGLASAAGEDGGRAAEKLGGVLFAAVSAARFLGVDAERALGGSVGRFAACVKAVEKAAPGEDLMGMSGERRDGLWEKAEAAEYGQVSQQR